jgi:hypothetical protein
MMVLTNVVLIIVDLVQLIPCLHNWSVIMIPETRLPTVKILNIATKMNDQGKDNIFQ